MACGCGGLVGWGLGVCGVCGVFGVCVGGVFGRDVGGCFGCVGG